jgi:hypothetical protein
MKLTISLTDCPSPHERTIENPDPSMMDKLFCETYSAIKFNTPKEIEIIGEVCESCSS